MAEQEPVNPFDTSMKRLIRECPAALLRLAGADVGLEHVRHEDTNVNLPELHADQVLVIEAGGSPDGAVYLEYQLQPDSDRVIHWFTKCGGLTRQLGMPVVLLVLYLEKGNRATFPDRYSVTVAGLTTEFRFATIRLWEHRTRIESGELAELAPLLVLCQDSPGEDTLRQEMGLIRSAGLPPTVQAELLAVAIRVAGARLPPDLVEAVFREELEMLGERTFLDDWIEERAQQRVSQASRVAEAAEETARAALAWAQAETERAKSEAQRAEAETARAEAETARVRAMARRVVEAKFGSLPPELARQITGADTAWCEQLVLRSLQVKSLDELDLTTNC